MNEKRSILTLKCWKYLNVEFTILGIKNYFVFKSFEFLSTTFQRQFSYISKLIERYNDRRNTA